MADRFDHWREWLAETHAPLEAGSEHAADFQAHARRLRLGAVTVWPATYQPFVSRRTPGLIRRADPDTYHLSLVLRGAVRTEWDGQAATYTPYDLHIRDSSRPCTIWAGQGRDMVESVGVEIPKDLLSIPRNRADQVIGRPMTARSGLGALLAGLLCHISTDTGAFTAGDGPRLATVVADLVSGLLARTLEAHDAPVSETRQRALLVRIQNFIESRLHDPELTPGAIAAAHHISVSYLHRLFQPGGVTVATWIRLRRLERARRALADPTLRAVPIHHVGVRCGFVNPATFTRVFRAAYGMTPSEYRRHLTT